MEKTRISADITKAFQKLYPEPTLTQNLQPNEVIYHSHDLSQLQNFSYL